MKQLLTFISFLNKPPSLLLLQILHLFTNPLIFVSQSFLLNLTPALFGLTFNLFGKEFKVNAAFFYLAYLCTYSFLLDAFSGFFHMLYMVFFFSLVPNYGAWVTRVVGVRLTNITAFGLYLFGNFSQILYGHEVRENFYDNNFYQVSFFPMFDVPLNISSFL